MKINDIFSLINQSVDGEIIRDYATEWRQYPLKLSFSSYAEGINYLKSKYEEFGLESEILHFPADGKTVYADRHFPLAWDVIDGWAEIDGERIADYKENTYGIIPFSSDSNGICEKTLVEIEKLPAEGTLEDYIALIAHYPSGEEVSTLIERGCPAFLSTFALEPCHPSLEDGRRWYNNMFGGGQIDCRDKTNVGFSITPRKTKAILKRLQNGEKITVRYLMKTRTYEGDAPAVTAVIPGREPEKCFFITAHAYEPHATNNVAGVGMCLGLAQTIAKLIKEGKMPQPKYSIRFFNGLEIFSLYAWAMNNREKMKASVGGISVDSFGRKGACGFKEKFVLRRCLNINPSNQHALAREILSMVCDSRGIEFEVNESSSNNEEVMQDPGFGPAWNLLYGSLWEKPSKPLGYFYHTDVDTPDQLSPEMLSGAAVMAGTLAYSVAEDCEHEYFSELALQDWKRIVDDKCREALRLKDTDEASRVLRAQRLVIWGDLSEYSGAEAIGDSKKAAEFKVYIRTKISQATSVLCGGTPPRLRALKGYDDVLRRKIPGLLGLGTISDELRQLAAEAQGYFANEYWCLDDSGTNFYHFDGNKTVFDVAKACWGTRTYTETEDLQGLEKELEHYSKLAKVLMLSGLAEKVEPTIVTKNDIIRGLKEIGIKAGDKVMVHSSLKSFGRVDGGADAVIDALMETVTKKGIVAMPGLTDCGLGGIRGAYNRDTTPIEPWIGIIPETFRKRDGVIRSLHPTHSVCAFGDEAEKFIDQKDPYDCFAKDGPWGKLMEQDGKILFLGESYGSNTFLHACEAWYNYYLDQTMALVETEEGEKMVRVTNYPGGCRGGWYKLGREAEHFKALWERGVYTETKVGNASVMVCKASDVAKVMKELFEKDPHILLHKTGCRDCSRMMAKKAH